MDTIHFSVDLPVGELRACAVVAGRFVEPDERVETGYVSLTADGRRRTWRAQGPAVALELAGGPDDEHYELLVPTRLVNATALVAGTGDAVTLAAGTNRGRPAVELRGPGGAVTVAIHRGTAPSPQLPLTEEETAASAFVGAAALREALALAMQVPFGFDGQRTAWPEMTVTISDDSIEIAVDWPAFGRAQHIVPATTAGAGQAAVMPGALAALLDVYEEDEIVVKLPHLPGDPIELSWDGWTGSVTQVDLDGDWPARAEEVMVEAFGPDVVHSGGEGLHELASDPAVMARLSSEPPWRLEVSSVLLVGVTPTPELHSELNDHNRHLGLARVAAHGGTVVMQSDLLVESLDAAQLRTTVEWIRHQTTRLAPLLAAVFGGTDPNRHSHESR